MNKDMAGTMCVNSETGQLGKWAQVCRRSGDCRANVGQVKLIRVGQTSNIGGSEVKWNKEEEVWNNIKQEDRISLKDIGTVS